MVRRSRTDRPRCAGGTGLAGRSAPADLHLRSDRVCGGDRAGAGGYGPSTGADQDRAFRTHGNLMEPLDGNAIAGSLFEYYGTEMTALIGSCGHCGALARVAELVVYARAPGAVARCPS